MGQVVTVSAKSNVRGSREGVDEQRVVVHGSIELGLDEVEHAVVPEGAPLDVDDHLGKRSDTFLYVFVQWSLPYFHVFQKRAPSPRR